MQEVGAMQCAKVLAEHTVINGTFGLQVGSEDDN